MFSKAKLKRFNEEVGCAPPPTAYDPKVRNSNKSAVTLDRSERWKASKEITPGPGTYTSQSTTSPTKLRSSSSKLNSSTCSSTSTTSGSGFFLSPQKPDRLTRSHSMRTVRPRAEKDSKASDLESQIKELTDERTELKQLISQLEKQVEELQAKISSNCPSPVAAEEIQAHNKESSQIESYKAELEEARFTLDDNEAQMDSLNATISYLTQQNEHLRSLIDNGGATGREEVELQKQLEDTKAELSDAQQRISFLTDERSGLQLQLRKLEESAEKQSLSEDELQSLRDHLEHLTVLRDNLEATARAKDDLIAELQVQLDEVVVEGRSYHEQMEAYKSKVEELEEELQNSFIDRDEAESRVRGLVAKYEAFMRDQVEERELNREILAKKDIEIELLNASLSNLNMKASEYESAITSLREEHNGRLSKISILENTISDLSMKTNEKEMMESILGEELNQRTDEVKLLEDNIKELDKKLQAVKKERDEVERKLEEEKKICEELRKRVDTLEVHIKEKEVVQQFLEKEISSREAEVTESSTKVKVLEEELETAQLVVVDLQQDADTKDKEISSLKDTIKIRDSDYEAKEELLRTLREELSKKNSEESELQEQIQIEKDTKAKLEEELTSNMEKVNELGTELASIKADLLSRDESLKSHESKMIILEDNNSQLEEKVVELMAEISDREAQHIVKIKTIESDLEDIGVKYSESLLEHEATRRVLTQTLEQVETEKLLRMGAESDIESLKEDVNKLKAEKEAVEVNMKDLVQKYTSLEDALACEEAENRDLEERLEREVSLAKEVAEQLSSMQTSNEGFCTQITQLKIDMRKKSQAVEEMQLCIDGLRDEKQHLTTLRDNLEKTVESKEETIAKLHLQASTLEREMEEERMTLRSRIADLENHLKEAQREHEMDTKKIREIEEKLLSLEEENIHLGKSYEKQIEEKTIAETAANAKLEELKNRYEGYEDQLKNMQTSLVEKCAEVDTLQEKCTAANSTMESCREEMKILETSVKRYKREIEAMNKTLASKDASLDSLNITLGTKSEEVQALYKTLEEKQAALLSSECHVQQLEEREEKLVKEKDQLAISMSSIQGDLSEVRSQYSRLESTFIEEKTAEISEVKSQYELDLDELRSLNSSLQEEMDDWKNKFQYLENMIEPFREQLDAYEAEKVNLLTRSSSAKEEVDKLSKQYATLLGHQNHKQKIQHVLKLKTENNTLREDVHKLRLENDKQRKTIRRLEERMLKISGSTSRLNETGKSMDKENSFYCGSNSQLPTSTPLKPSNKPHRI